MSGKTLLNRCLMLFLCAVSEAVIIRIREFDNYDALVPKVHALHAETKAKHAGEQVGGGLGGAFSWLGNALYDVFVKPFESLWAEKKSGEIHKETHLPSGALPRWIQYLSQVDNAGTGKVPVCLDPRRTSGHFQDFEEDLSSFAPNNRFPEVNSQYFVAIAGGRDILGTLQYRIVESDNECIIDQCLAWNMDVMDLLLDTIQTQFNKMKITHVAHSEARAKLFCCERFEFVPEGNDRNVKPYDVDWTKDNFSMVWCPKIKALAFNPAGSEDDLGITIEHFEDGFKKVVDVLFNGQAQKLGVRPGWMITGVVKMRRKRWKLTKLVITFDTKPSKRRRRSEKPKRCVQTKLETKASAA